MVMRTRARDSRVQLFQAPQIHGCGQQRNHVRVESLPVWVVQVVLLRLQRLLVSSTVLCHFFNSISEV
jgi:hypothetical protein